MASCPEKALSRRESETGSAVYPKITFKLTNGVCKILG